MFDNYKGKLSKPYFRVYKDSQNTVKRGVRDTVRQSVNQGS